MPKLNSQRIYNRTIIDNSGNTIDETLSDTVTAVNADGSYVVLAEDPNHDSVTVNGTIYSIVTEAVSVNDSDQDTAYSYTAADGSTIKCTYVPHGGGPDLPLTVGATWTITYNFSCGANLPVACPPTHGRKWIAPPSGPSCRHIFSRETAEHPHVDWTRGNNAHAIDNELA